MLKNNVTSAITHALAVGVKNNAGRGSGEGVSDEEDRKAFQDFLRDFKKTYSEENGEFGRRLSVFAQTRRRVAKMQAEGVKWAGITQFADVSTEERKQMLISGDVVNKMAGSASQEVPTAAGNGNSGRTKRQTPPSSFDYRTYGWVTPIKHQVKPQNNAGLQRNCMSWSLRLTRFRITRVLE
ncbi:putative cysteine protease RD19D [Ditylenchus destructor]|nr:putative cysteine protease RD19D [Ditylenchus destructor]